MRKLVVFLLIFGFGLVLSIVPIWARDNESTSGGQNSTSGKFDQRLDLTKKKLEIQDKKQEFRNEHEASREQEASKQAEVKAKVQENLTKRLSNTKRHLNLYLERLDKIAAKIASRIVKFKAKGVDTTKAEAKLAEAKILGSSAKIAIDKAVLDIGSATDKASVDNAINSVKAAKTALFNYHKGLVFALRELKSAANLREGSGSAKEASESGI